MGATKRVVYESRTCMHIITDSYLCANKETPVIPSSISRDSLHPIMHKIRHHLLITHDHSSGRVYSP